MQPNNRDYERFLRKHQTEENYDESEVNQAINKIIVTVLIILVASIVVALAYAYNYPEQTQIWAGLKKYCNGNIVVNRGKWDYGDHSREDRRSTSR